MHKNEADLCVEGEAAKSINLYFGVEQGYHIFSFVPEDRAEDTQCLIGAKTIRYKLADTGAS